MIGSSGKNGIYLDNFKHRRYRWPKTLLLQHMKFGVPYCCTTKSSYLATLLQFNKIISNYYINVFHTDTVIAMCPWYIAIQDYYYYQYQRDRSMMEGCQLFKYARTTHIIHTTSQDFPNQIQTYCVRLLRQFLHVSTQCIAHNNYEIKLEHSRYEIMLCFFLYNPMHTAIDTQLQHTRTHGSKVAKTK